MREQRPRRCRTCRKVLVYSGLGKPPSYCLDHRPNRARDRRNAESKLAEVIGTLKETEAQQRLAELSAPDIAASPTAPRPIPAIWQSRILAIARGLESDPLRAAALVGIDLSDETARASMLAESDRHSDLTDAKPGAVGRLVLTAISLVAIRLAAEWEHIPLAQLPAAQRSLAQSLELIQGTTMPAYSEIRLVIEQPTIPTPANGS